MACAPCAPRYCAPNRCYCGHRECDAYATFVSHTKSSSTDPRVAGVTPGGGPQS
jgi:hypothetical protein